MDPPEAWSVNSLFASSFEGESLHCQVSYVKVCETTRKFKKRIAWIEGSMQRQGLLDEDEKIEGLFDEEGVEASLEEVFEDLSKGKMQIEVSHELHGELSQIVEVNTKYKTVDRKVRPAATPLPYDAKEILEKASKESSLRDRSKIGHQFTEETLNQLRIGDDGLLTREEREVFRKVIGKHGKAFAFTPEEMGCVDPSVVTPMVIFTVPHIPWDLKPIPVPKALMPKLIDLLKEKLANRVLERADAPYSNRWFTIRKKNGKLRFIQDMQPPNKVTIRNTGIGPVVDEFAEEFAGRAIYSCGDLYSGYDQFQLAQSSRDITTMRTPLGLLRMCTLPQGATNSVAHMQNAMNKIFQAFIPEKTQPFLDDMPIKGCLETKKDETMRKDGLRQFVWEHIQDVEAILKRMIEVGLTFSGEKSSFGLREVLIVGQNCGTYGRRPNGVKVDAINQMKDCRSTSEVRRFLGACIFYRIWIPHFAHIADPLYGLLRKNVPFVWTKVHREAMQRLKEALLSPPVLRPLCYDGRFIIVTVDSSPDAAGWAIGQDDEEGRRFASRFGAKIFSARQRHYPQIKRELWGARTALRQEKDYLIGAQVILETDCLPLLGMIANCDTPDIAMLRWIAFIRMINPELRHIAGKNNPVADMLSRARYDGEVETFQVMNGEFEILAFREELYSGELFLIGRYLSTLQKSLEMTQEEFHQLRKKAYKFMLKDGVLWKKPLKKGHVPRRVLDTDEEKKRVLWDCHDAVEAGHRGVRATYEKVQRWYWWSGMYVDVKSYVGSCKTCQYYSKVRFRDGLNPTSPLSLHFQWAVDVVHMPLGVRGAKYLVLAREDLSSYVEGRALPSNTTEAVCRFILEDVIARHGCFVQMRADRGELHSEEAREFFERFNIKLKLTTAYNPEGNGKIERGHPSIVNALVKSCQGKTSQWPNLLPFALLADRMTCTTTTGVAPAELVSGHLPLMKIEESVQSWRTIAWQDGVSHEELLERRIEHFSQTKEKIEEALHRLKEAREKNKARFDKTHRLRPVPIKEGDWVLIYEGGLDQQHSTIKKFARRWRGPFVVEEVRPNATYVVRELDGTFHRYPYAGKRVKLFRRRTRFIVEEEFEPDDLEVLDEEGIA
jgi:transposase InsO family protein